MTHPSKKVRLQRQRATFLIMVVVGLILAALLATYHNRPLPTGASSGSKYVTVRKSNGELRLLEKPTPESTPTVVPIAVPAPVLQTPKTIVEAQAIQLASRSTPTYSREDVLLLAKVIAGEARGETYHGKLAVGTVIVNRMAKYGMSLKEIVYQPYQFDCTLEANWSTLVPDDECIRASNEVLNNDYRSFSGEVVYYYNPATATDYSFTSSVTVVMRIANHVFAK